MKLCPVCQEEKFDNDFNKDNKRKDGLQFRCRLCEKKYKDSRKQERLEYNRNWISNNKRKYKKYLKCWYKRNIEYIKEYRKINVLHIRTVRNAYNRKRRKENLSIRLHAHISSIVRRRVRTQLKLIRKSVLDYVPFTIEEFKKHIESQFEPWMNWNNWSRYNPKIWNDNDASTWKWNIDHIIPRSDLPYTSLKSTNFKKCWSLNNLRPLSAKQNIIDGVCRTRHLSKRSK